MPALVKIANHDNSGYYDFTDNSNIVLVINQSITDSTTVNGEPVNISFKTVAKGTASEIRLAIEEIERLLHRSNKWHEDETEEESFWLHIGSDGESGRRALIIDWSHTDTVEGNSDPLLDNAIMLISEWNITRGAYWEALHTALHNVPNTFLSNLTTSPSQYQTPGSNPGGRHMFASTTHNELGTAPGRIENIRVLAATTAGSNVFERLWFGIKAIKTAFDTNWTPCIKFDDTWGMNIVPLEAWTSLHEADTNAVDDVCAELLFTGTEEFTNRIAAGIGAESEDHEELRGTYLVLARMRVTAGSTLCRTAMFQTWDYSTQSTYGGLKVGDVFQDVYVESQKYHLYEMGVIQIPPEAFRHARRSQEPDMYQLKLGLAVERLTGAGNLRIDYMALIPQEFSFTIDNLKLGTGRTTDIFTDELMNQLVLTTRWQTVWEKFVGELSAKNLVWPCVPGQYLAAVAAADIEINDADAEHHPIVTGDSGQAITFEFNVIPRYYSYNAD